MLETNEFKIFKALHTKNSYKYKKKCPALKYYHVPVKVRQSLNYSVKY